MVPWKDGALIEADGIWRLEVQSSQAWSLGKDRENREEFFFFQSRRGNPFFILIVVSDTTIPLEFDQSA